VSSKPAEVLSLDPTAVRTRWSEHAMRDVTNIGHFGMGDVEYSVRDADQIEDARQLVNLAYTSLS
jgi:predicted transport protein